MWKRGKDGKCNTTRHQATSQWLQKTPLQLSALSGITGILEFLLLLLFYLFDFIDIFTLFSHSNPIPISGSSSNPT